MRLKQKSLFIIGVFFICLIGILFVLCRYWLLEDIIRLEGKPAEKHAKRLVNALEGETKHLSISTELIAHNPGLFIDDGNGGSEAKTYDDLLHRHFFERLRIDAIVFTNAEGKVIFSRFFKAGSEGLDVPPDGFNQFIPAIVGRIKSLKIQKSLNGITVIDDRLAMISAARISPAADGAMPDDRFAVLLIRFIDDEEIREVSRITQTKVEYEIWGEGSIAGGYDVAKKHIAKGASVYLSPLPGRNMAAYCMLRDVFGNPAAIMRTEFSSQIIYETRVLLRRFVLMVMVAGVLFGFITIMLLQNQVISRLDGLVDNVRRVGASMDLSRRMPAGGDDEISYLAKSINGMLSGLEQAQFSLMKSEEEHRSLIENLNVGVFRHEADPGGRYLMANHAIAKMFGYETVEQFLSTPMEEFFISREQMMGLVNEVAMRGEAKDWELEMKRRDGGTILVSCSCKAVFDTIGNFTVIDGLVEDITESRRAEQSVREALVRFESVIENTPMVAVQGIDREGVILHWNSANMPIYGYQAKDVLGKRIQDVIIGTEMLMEFEKVIERVWTTGQPHGPAEWCVVNRNGAEKWVYSSVFPVFDKGQAIELFCMNVDITHRRAIEQELRLSEEMYRDTINSFSDPLHVVDSNMRLTIVNHAFTAWLDSLGMDNDIIGRNLFKVFYFLPEKVLKEYEAVFKSGQALVTEERTEFAGNLIFTETRKIPVFQNDKVDRVITVVRNITGRKLAEQELSRHKEHLEELVQQRTKELEKARDMLESSQRLAILGRFAGGISHEIRNPLAVISTVVYYLKKKLNDSDAPTLESLDKIKRQVDNCNSIIESILDLTRTDSSSFEKVDVCQVLRTSIDNIIVPPNIKIAMKLCPSPLHVMGGSGQLGLVFGNIIRNALQAMPEGGDLTLTAESVESNGMNCVKVTVSDTGAGISEENRERIFEPLFTTKLRGTGLGLAIVKMVVEKHGGSISVEAESEKGAIFAVTIPAA